MSHVAPVFQAPHAASQSMAHATVPPTGPTARKLTSRESEGPVIGSDLSSDPGVDPGAQAVHLRAEASGRPMLLPIVVIVAMLAGFGCAKPVAHPWVTRDGLVEVETYNRGKLFVKRDHHLGDYDNLLIDHVGFRYGPRQVRLRDGQEDRIVSMLLGAVQGSQDGTIGLAATPGPCVLTVNFFLKDLELETPAWRSDSTTNFVSSYGAATMVLELRDSMDQEPLARFIQRRDLGGGQATVGHRMSFFRLRHVMSFALRDMGNELRKVIPPTAQGADSRTGGCRGGMGQVALGSL